MVHSGVVRLCPHLGSQKCEPKQLVAEIPSTEAEPIRNFGGTVCFASARGRFVSNPRLLFCSLGRKLW